VVLYGSKEYYIKKANKSWCKGKMSIEIRNKQDNNIINEVFIEVPELQFESSCQNGVSVIDGTCPLTQYTIKCSADGYMSYLDGYNDDRGITHITTDKDGNWRGTIHLNEPAFP
jgi:hypothetical protein